MSTRVRSYSKINLGLRIGPVRADGFHALVTLYQTLALHDLVTVEVKPTSQSRDVGHPDSSQGTKITLTTNDARVPTDARNTAWKMVELALERMGVAAEVAIHIEKELPVRGGMGAGSANAAAALIGLERELGRALPEAERLAIAAEVGSDVPLFLVGGAVLGVGRGEIVSAMAVDLPETWCVVAVPEVGVSTPQAFRDWDALWADGGGGALEGDVPGAKARVDLEPVMPGLKSRPISEASAASPAGSTATNGGEEGVSGGQEAVRRGQVVKGGGLTGDPQLGRLEELSHAYASVLGTNRQKLGNSATEVAPDTSGIVRGPSPESKQGSEQSFTAAHVEQGSTLNGLAGNPLLALVRTGIENDFEQVVFPQYPTLREIKRMLMGSSAGVVSGDSADLSGDAIYAALSGSGSALFGLYESESDARAAQRRVQASGCRAILTKTLPRQEYWSNMFAE
ncbi:MAG TPA: 4-(cytidine 5'-diphospho)-2-C-methyl-D-erythritol kinase [Acidobacteriaceae bacterium]|nr:4-(cytidine 5'-diphospho)-2-C-methyl-D-erythritol kinase [Acidobacteriaceae bacterium]